MPLKSKFHDKIPIDLLGTKFDADIAKQVGCPLDTVRDLRRKLKIKPYAGVQPHRKLKAEHIAMMSTVPTMKLAQIAGVEPSTITRYRQRYNIKAPKPAKTGRPRKSN